MTPMIPSELEADNEPNGLVLAEIARKMFAKWVKLGLVKPESKRDLVPAVLLRIVLTPFLYLAMYVGAVVFFALTGVAIVLVPVVALLNLVIEADVVEYVRHGIAWAAFGPAELIRRAGRFPAV